MKVWIWDDRIIVVKDRDEAVKVIKHELSAWMEDSDHLAWFRVEEHDKMPKLPNQAYVYSEFGEMTDAFAMILE